MLSAIYTSGQKISSLELDGVGWGLFEETFMESSAEALRTRKLLSNLRQFQLRISSTGTNAKCTGAYGRLGSLLCEPPLYRLGVLELQLRYPCDWHQILPGFFRYPHLSSIHLLQSFTCYPALKELHLGGFFTTEEDFLAFLRRHATTLVRLSLGDLGLLPARKLEDPTGKSPSTCWVKILKKIHLMLNLEEVGFRGTLASATQRWHCGQLRISTNTRTRVGLADRPCHPKSLKGRVERFVVQGGECPLDCLAVGTQNRGRTKIARQKLGTGDESWRIGVVPKRHWG